MQNNTQFNQDAPAKMCKQCGEVRLLTEYRRYYSTANVPKPYKYCLHCERVNSRHKYLRRKASKHTDGAPALSAAETQELQAIEDLYNAQRVRGLRPPNTNAIDRMGVMDIVNKMKEAACSTNSPKLIDVPDKLQATFVGDLPEELQYWLCKPLDELEPEYLQETVYEQLKAKFRPLKCVDKESLLPVYDDTYRQTLDEILKRFDDYEEGLA